MTDDIKSLVRNLISKMRKRHQKLDEGRIYLAAETAYFAHKDFRRESGEPYIYHPLNVALILADLGMDEDVIISALLHDVLEDSKLYDLQFIKSNFGDHVAELVDAVTKLSHAEKEYLRKEITQAENIRKLILAMAKDIRVIFIKLADRLHNMQTLYALPRERQKKMAEETMQVFAPLANRLGIWEFKWRLEDLAFQYLYPKEFENLKEQLEKIRVDRETEVEEAGKILKERLAKENIDATVYGRAKHLWSIYKKMQRDNIPLEEVYDLVALRVIVYTKEQCYIALSIVHDLWTPIPGMFTDFIASPKPNGYRSLHTKVIGPRGKPLEVQIRTWDMHREAEFGLAAHWFYKSDAKDDKDFLERIRQLRSQIFTWQADYGDPTEFFRSVVEDLFADRVFVFSPKGDIFDLPAGSTPVDFAYLIHTELGNKCVGAKVNGKIVPLDYVLNTGDKVEILTRSSARPSLEWLRFVKTSHAKSCIKRFFKQQNREEAIEKGKNLLSKEIANIPNLPPDFSLEKVLQELAPRLGFASPTDLLASIGYGSTSLTSIVEKIKRKYVLPPNIEVLESAPKVSIPEIGMDGLLIKRARCCYPLPGEDVIGFITRGKGIVVHLSACPNIENLPPEEKKRLVKINWGRSEKAVPVAIEVEALDRIGLVSDISAIISSEGINIRSLKVATKANNTAFIKAVIDVVDAKSLNKIVEKISNLSDVLNVRRVGIPQKRSKV
ncbi:bifunctional (p)ppGpp synthetase/guanosine-3',5'-bis(diphosphate) 3'-pyrophosphohydrolase [bacterium]|nr:bifunctional (p)ppGpp synthetase/guanosine-3',5'-bis(diphosphate) 3'-pyrophosphohydrolase [bacterium]